jgi:NADP-reducing hydrogenase subunit HndB
MPKLKLEDLAKIKDKVKSETSLRAGGYRAKITVHMGTCGIASGARKVMQAMMDEMATLDVKDVILTTSGCAGLCSREPMATVELKDESPVKYVDLDEEKARTIFKEHVQGGKVVEAYALAVGSETSY